MPTEYKNIKFEVYRTPDTLEPTCALNFDKEGEVCPFLFFSNFGTKEECFDKTELHRRTINGIETGYLIPHENCILWKGQI